MDNIPKGVRRPEDAHLFRKQTDDPCIEPDRVSAPVEGYFRIPAIWVGEIPNSDAARFLSPAVHHQVMFRKTLRCGIEVCVQRDGTFLFDFTSSPIASMVTVPGYRHPPTPPYSPPTETAKEGERVEIHAVLRAQIMNAHQACLATSEHVVKHRSAMMGFPITASNTLIGLTFSGASQSYHDDTENLHALSRNVLNNKYGIGENRPFSRRLIEIEVVEHSLELLDNIICCGGEKLIQLVETTYIAASRYYERRYGEAITLAWGVCEQLISSAWERLIHDTQVSGIDKNRMSRDRREKLTGRDYSASVMVEVLEISGRIDTTLYRMLEIARKSRNNWAHKMKSPKDIEVYTCIRAVEALLAKIGGANISFQFSGRGSSAPWPYWFWEQITGRRGP